METVTGTITALYLVRDDDGTITQYIYIDNVSFPVYQRDGLLPTLLGQTATVTVDADGWATEIKLGS